VVLDIFTINTLSIIHIHQKQTLEKLIAYQSARDSKLPQAKVRYRVLYILLILMLLFCVSRKVCVAAEYQLVVSGIDGVVRSQSTGTEGWFDIEPDHKLEDGESLKAGEESKAEISINDYPAIRLQSNSTIGLSYPTNSNIIIDVEEGIVDLELNEVGDIAIEINSTVIKMTVSKCLAKIMVGSDGTTEIKLYHGQITVDTVPIKPDEMSDSTSTDNKIILPETVVLDNMNKLIVTSTGAVVYSAEFSSDDIDESNVNQIIK